MASSSPVACPEGGWPESSGGAICAVGLAGARRIAFFREGGLWVVWRLRPAPLGSRLGGSLAWAREMLSSQTGGWRERDQAPRGVPMPDCGRSNMPGRGAGGPAGPNFSKKFAVALPGRDIRWRNFDAHSIPGALRGGRESKPNGRRQCRVITDSVADAPTRHE